MKTLTTSCAADTVLINLLANAEVHADLSNLPQTCENLEIKLDCAAMSIDHVDTTPYKLGLLQSMYVNLMTKAQKLHEAVNQFSHNLKDTKARLALILGLADSATTGRAEALADLFEANPDDKETMAVLFRDYQKALVIHEQRRMQGAYDDACEKEEEQHAA